MTIEQYIPKLSELSRITAESIVVPAANNLLGLIRNRIQRDGKNSNESNITPYSTKPGYFSKEQFDKKGSFKAVGKTGKKTKSTMYISSGYKGLRDIQGKPTNISNQTYTGSTLASYQLQVVSDGVLMGMVNEKASVIRKGQEQKKGMRIYPPSASEIAEYQKEVIEETRKVTEAIFNV